MLALPFYDKYRSMSLKARLDRNASGPPRQDQALHAGSALGASRPKPDANATTGTCACGHQTEAQRPRGPREPVTRHHVASEDDSSSVPEWHTARLGLKTVLEEALSQSGAVRSRTAGTSSKRLQASMNQRSSSCCDLRVINRASCACWLAPTPQNHTSVLPRRDLDTELTGRFLAGWTDSSEALGDVAVNAH